MGGFDKTSDLISQQGFVIVYCLSKTILDVITFGDNKMNRGSTTTSTMNDGTWDAMVCQHKTPLSSPLSGQT